MMIARPIVTAHIRWMVRRDMPRVMEIENQSFDVNWTEDEFIKRLRTRTIIGMVAETPDEKVCGSMIYELHRNRIHLQRLAVDPAYRFQGVGSEMIDKLVGKLSKVYRERILLEVRDTNLGAHKFLKKRGFKSITTLRDFYGDYCDAYLFQLRVDQTSGKVKP